jgi:hypothetical protein
VVVVSLGGTATVWFRLTAEGRQALRGHLAWLDQLEEAVSAGLGGAEQAGPIPGDGEPSPAETENAEGEARVRSIKRF